MRRELAQALEWLTQGDQVALARVIAAEGSAPRPIGATMAISARGGFTGSVSGGCVEGSVIAAASDVITSGQAQTLHFRGAADPLTEIALGCGGTETIFVEPFTPSFQQLHDLLRHDHACQFETQLSAMPWHRLYDPHGNLIAEDGVQQPSGEVFTQDFLPRPRLIIVGADAVGQAVANQGTFLGWRVVVIDPRPAWLFGRHFNADERINRWPDEALHALALTATDTVVVLSHDPKFDEPALLEALRSPTGYIGALGSRTAHRDRLDRLRHAGITETELHRLHAPIGLDLGGHSPQEIALSIVAEIVAAQYGRSGGELRHGSGPIHDMSAPTCAPVEGALAE